MSKQDTQPAQMPTGITLHKKSRYLEIRYSNGDSYNLPFEYLREFSPAAEEKESRAIENSVSGDQVVNIRAINPVGSYALQIEFDDGYETGIYSWARLYDMAVNMQHDWEERDAARLVSEGLSDQAGKRVIAERTITILYAGSLATRLGLNNETITLPAEVVTVGELIPWLMTRRGEWEKALSGNLKIAINRGFVGLRDKIHDEDQIALVLAAKV